MMDPAVEQGAKDRALENSVLQAERSLSAEAHIVCAIVWLVAWIPFMVRCVVIRQCVQSRGCSPSPR